jgi:hypothetical protein
MIVSTPAFLRADNFEEVIVSAVSMIFGMGPPKSRLNGKVMPRKNLATPVPVSGTPLGEVDGTHNPNLRAKLGMNAGKAFKPRGGKL